MPDPFWIACQIGAREHYAIPRALHRDDMLDSLITDFWVRPGTFFSTLPGGKRLRDRFHDDLAEAKIHSFNSQSLSFEFHRRLKNSTTWHTILARNKLFQDRAVRHLADIGRKKRLTNKVTLFSYSYAALNLFQFAKSLGWKTVLGQIDPGPEEERIVQGEHCRYDRIRSNWDPAPENYWENWKKETELADSIIVNSEWSRECLLRQGVPDSKIKLVPLAYEKKTATDISGLEVSQKAKFQVLYLGTIALRKGVARLVEAMRKLDPEKYELLLAGPAEVEPECWKDAENIRWIGPVARREVETIYQNADVFILPTLSDGFAITQLEALANGLPVIASRRCGQVVENGKNGWILEDLEPETIARAITLASVELHSLPADFECPSGIAELAKSLKQI